MIPYDKLFVLGIITLQEYMVWSQQKEIQRLRTKLTSYQEQVSYLCSILNKHQIKLDEFDHIALPNVTTIRREINTD